MSFLHLIFVLRLLLTFFSLLLFHDFFSQNFAKLRNPMEGDPGFFLDDWEEKRNPKISYSKNPLITNSEATVSAVVDFSKPLGSSRVGRDHFPSKYGEGHPTIRNLTEKPKT